MRLLSSAIQLVSHPYWLIKAELLQLVSETDFASMTFLETESTMNGGLLSSSSSRHRPSHRYLGSTQRVQARVLEVVNTLACDEDPRVRNAAATALSRVVAKLFYPSTTLSSSPSNVGSVGCRGGGSKETTFSALHRVAETLAGRYFEPFAYERLLPLPPLLHGTAFPFHVSSSFSSSFSSRIESNLR